MRDNLDQNNIRDKMASELREIIFLELCDISAGGGVKMRDKLLLEGM